MKIIAKTLEGLEQVLASELESLEVQDIQILKRAVTYSGDLTVLYKSNLQLRTCLRVLVFVKEFEIKDESDLYTEVKGMKWEDYIDLDDTFAIDSIVNSDKFRHANYIALKAKDAIADRFRDKYGKRPSVDVKNPDLKINVHIRQNIVTISLDSSGSSLHMRGYRKNHVDAPLNEVLAAGLVLISKWDKSSPLIDPMCGSGTILCEAAMIASNQPPQKMTRNFAFMKWKNYDEALWKAICSKAEKEITHVNLPSITGGDKMKPSVQAAVTNIAEAGLQDIISVEQSDFFYHDGAQNTMLIFNPPYDVRLKETEITDFYKHIGDKLKMSFKNCTAWILSGHLDALKQLGLRPSSRIPLLNGEIPSLFCKFEMYEGSKKAKWKNIESPDTSSTNV